MTTAARLTDEQHAAIATRGVSVALDAGAGCGKTFVLTERFLSHLEPEGDDAPPAELHELVAITFTDAAAREMRERIRRACLDRLHRAADSSSAYWLRLLRSIDAARVSTIHGFCGALLRSHAVDVGLDPLFRVLDAGAADVLRSETTDAVLRQRLADRDARAMRLAVEFDLPGLKQRLGVLLDRAADVEFAEWLKRTPQEAIAVWREAYRAEYLPQVAARVAASPAFAELREVLPAAQPATPKFADARGELLALAEQLAAGDASSGTLQRLQELARVQGISTGKDWPDKPTFERYKSACTAVRALAAKAKPLLTDEALHDTAALGFDVMKIADDVARAYSDAKRSHAVLDYDDLLAEARRLLTAKQFTAVQRRLQSQTRLLLVDEFQDTDRTQVEIVKALVGKGFDSGKLFFVGDFKQSIYRFRGAEPGVFRTLQDETPAEGRLPLATNFRSQPAVLAFVNELFAPVFADGYTPLRAARPQVTEAPAVEFLATPPPDDGGKPAARKAEARAIARRLKGLLESEEPVVGRKSDDGVWRPTPAAPGDIAILFRALSDVRHYEQALRDEEIDYRLVGGHAFYSQQEVHDVANLLRAVASPCDEIALAGVLRSPFFSLLDETLFALTERSGGLAPGFAALRAPTGLPAGEADKLDRARSVLHQLRDRKGEANVAEILTTAIRLTAYDAVLLSEHLGERKLANLDKLVEQARAFDAYRPGDLDGFVRQLSEFVAREPKEALAAPPTESRGQVTLMTVHGAKGLEFPVVVLADLGRKSQAEKAPAAFSPQLGPLVRRDGDAGAGIGGLEIHRLAEQADDREELDRLFYVACTRAADYLILSASWEDNKPDGEWLATLADRFDLATGETKPGEHRAGGGPLMKVATQPTKPPMPPTPKRGVNRVQLLEQAAAAKRGAPPVGIEPLRVSGDDLRRFSVSRLTGRLQHGAARPAAVGVEAALRAEHDDVDPRGLGTLTHALLERLTPSGDNPVGVWSRALAPLHVTRNVDEAARQAEELVNRFVASPRWSSMRSAPRLEREVEFLLRWPPDREPGDGAYLQGYIDCLVQTADGGWRVLDYKTNRVDAAGVAQEAEQYRLQLSVYAMAVEQAIGAPPAELCIHFLRPGAEVTFAWDDAARRRAHELIDQAIAAVRTEAAEPS